MRKKNMKKSRRKKRKNNIKKLKKKGQSILELNDFIILNHFVT